MAPDIILIVLFMEKAQCYHSNSKILTLVNILTNVTHRQIFNYCRMSLCGDVHRHIA